MIRIPSDFSPLERSERAAALFKQGYNCAQSVVLAFEDILPLDAGTLATLATGFGGGIGRMREVCGTVSGMTILAGFISPAIPSASGADAGDMHAAKSANYALVQQFAARFRAECGSIICRELLSGTPASAHNVPASGPDSPIAAPRTEEYYRKRPCGELCALAARIVADHLAANG